MDKVGKKHFPYTEKGMESAMAASKKPGKPMMNMKKGSKKK